MHQYIKQATLSVCAKCGKPVRSHTMCWNCGFYKSREVVNVLGKLAKKEKKKREKEIAAQGKESGAEKPLTAEELSKKV